MRSPMRLAHWGALERGAYTISDERKETTEFNLGKNVL